MHLVPFAPVHLTALRLQAAQAPYFGHQLTAETGTALQQLGPAYTVLDDDTAIACFGLLHIWPGRADCWALVGAALSGARFVVLHRWVAGNLAAAQRLGYRRLETTIDPAFPAARRWAELLGFQREGRLRRYLPDGRDMLIYARTQP